MTAETTAAGQSAPTTRPVLAATGLVKSYGRVDALRGTDFELYPGEILAVIGDNGAGKSTLIRCLSGAETPDAGTITLDGVPVHFRDVQQAKQAGIETVYQTLAVSPALDIATNLYLGREVRKKGPLGSVFRMLDIAAMRRMAREHVTKLGIETLQDITQAVETLSGGQRQAVAVARAAAFGSKVIIMDEPTAALGVRESGQVAALIRRLKEEGLPIVLISHDMPSVFQLADRIHVQRLGRRAGIIKPGTHTMEQAVAIMTGAATALSSGPRISDTRRRSPGMPVLHIRADAVGLFLPRHKTPKVGYPAPGLALCSWFSPLVFRTYRGCAAGCPPRRAEVIIVGRWWLYPPRMTHDHGHPQTRHRICRIYPVPPKRPSRSGVPSGAIFTPDGTPSESAAWPPRRLPSARA